MVRYTLILLLMLSLAGCTTFRTTNQVDLDTKIVLNSMALDIAKLNYIHEESAFNKERVDTLTEKLSNLLKGKAK